MKTLEQAKAEALQGASDDITYAEALAAYEHVSHFPERRAESTVKGWPEGLAADWDDLAKSANTPEKVETLLEEFARYRARQVSLYRDYLAAKSRCVSWFIAGPANFPAAAQQKRQQSEHNKLNEYLDHGKRAKVAIIKKLTPELAPIMSGDSNALERLDAEISQSEKLHAAMIAANKVIRAAPKNKPTEEKTAKLCEILGMDALKVSKLFEPDFCGRLGFPDYALTNNGANLRRMKARRESIAAAKSKPNQELQLEGLRIEDCPAENRVRLFFDGKPDADTRASLKGNGFRWAPSMGAWQSYRNHRSAAFIARIRAEYAAIAA